MSTNDDESASMPTRTIHAAYQDALQARREYQQAVGTSFERAAHETLHDAIGAYYETLRPLVSSANATEDLWEEVDLWPTQPVYVDAGFCPACEASEALAQLEDADISLGDLCPNCGDAVIERREVPQTDENGQVVYHHVEGLEAVDGAWSQRVEREVEYSDALGTHSETQVETQLLRPDHLLTVARTLDEAMERLSLHADIDDDAPSTELDNEDLEAFQEQVAKIREEWSDDDGLDDKEVST